jgi:hypothetical protein
MNNTFYGPDENYYLEHHGILGMKWGKKNGPPYPLSDARHDRIVKRAEKRRQRIMKDPKKLYKHSEEFTKEELQEALDKIKVAKAVQREIPEKKRKNKKEKPVKLSGSKKKWAKDPFELAKHIDKYDEKELEKAKTILENNQYIFDKKMQKAARPKNILDLGIGYLSSITKAISGFKLFKKEVTPYDPKKLTDKEKHIDWLAQQGKTWLLNTDAINALDTATKNRILSESVYKIHPSWRPEKEEKKDPIRNKVDIFNEQVEKMKEDGINIDDKTYAYILKDIINGNNGGGGGKKKKR